MKAYRRNETVEHQDRVTGLMLPGQLMYGMNQVD
jgi:hypothetical protein